MIDIAARIEQTLELHRDRLALCIGGNRYSYGDLRQRILVIQPSIHSLGDQTLIGVAASDSLDTYAAILAVLRDGRGFVPINPTHPSKRNAAMLAQAGVRTLLVPDASLGELPGLPDGVRQVSTHDKRIGVIPEIVPRSPDALAY